MKQSRENEEFFRIAYQGLKGEEAEESVSARFARVIPEVIDRYLSTARRVHAPTANRRTRHPSVWERLSRGVLRATERRLCAFRARYAASTAREDPRVTEAVDSMLEQMERVGASCETAAQAPSLLERMGAVRALYRCHRLLAKSLSFVEEARPDPPTPTEEPPVAFAEVALPDGLKEALARVDWSVNDVLVGSLRQPSQLAVNLRDRYYYVPVRHLEKHTAPIRTVALYQSARLFGAEAGIRYYGEVEQITRVSRRTIPVPMSRNNGSEPYYVFHVREWKQLPSPIAVKSEGVSEPKMTNLFLLHHATHSFELFSLRSAEQYKLCQTLKRISEQVAAHPREGLPVYRIGGSYSLWVHGGRLELLNERGERLLDPPPEVEELRHRPKHYLELIGRKMRK